MKSQFVFASGTALLVSLPVSPHTGQESEEVSSLAVLAGGLLWEEETDSCPSETWDSVLFICQPIMVSHCYYQVSWWPVDIHYCPTDHFHMLNTVLLRENFYVTSHSDKINWIVFLHQIIIAKLWWNLNSGFPVFIFQGSNHLAVVLGDIILAVIDSIFVWFISFTMSKTVCCIIKIRLLLICNNDRMKCCYELLLSQLISLVEGEEVVTPQIRMVFVFSV